MKFTSAIIKAAWKIRKEAAAKFGCPVNEISWKFSFQMAKAEGEKKMKKLSNDEYRELTAEEKSVYRKELRDWEAKEKERKKNELLAKIPEGFKFVRWNTDSVTSEKLGMFVAPIGGDIVCDVKYIAA